MIELECWSCGTNLNDIPIPISRQANCPRCFNELHCCRLCAHFDRSIAATQCDEQRADPPVVKDGANFCDWFQPRPGAHTPDTTEKRDTALARLDELFGGDSPVSQKTSAVPLNKEEQARAELDRLFSARNPSHDRSDDNARED